MVMKSLIMIVQFSFYQYVVINYILVCLSDFLYFIQYQQSFLHAAATGGQSDSCKFLLANGININEVDWVSIEFHYSGVTTLIYIGYIFYGREIRLVIACGKAQWLSEAEEIWKLHESILFHDEYNRFYISDGSYVSNLYNT